MRFRVRGRNAAALEKALNILAAEIERVEKGRPRLTAGLGVLIDEGPDGFTVTATAQDAGGASATEPPLTLTTTVPPWWTPPVPDENPPKLRLFVTWGMVNNRVPIDKGGPSNGGILTPIEITNEVLTYVWLKVQFNADFNDVEWAEIHAGGAADLPQANQDASDLGARTFYFNLGQVQWVGATSPKTPFIANSGSGSVWCALYETFDGGCVLPDGSTIPVSRKRLAPAFWRMPL